MALARAPHKSVSSSTFTFVTMPADLLHPTSSHEKRVHKLKRLVQSPNRCAREGGGAVLLLSHSPGGQQPMSGISLPWGNRSSPFTSRKRNEGLGYIRDDSRCVVADLSHCLARLLTIDCDELAIMWPHSLVILGVLAETLPQNGPLGVIIGGVVQIRRAGCG